MTKGINFILVFSIFMAGCLEKSGPSKDTEKNAPPKMTFADTLFNFGLLHAGDKAEHTFTFINKGEKPVIIHNIQSFCGCTIPEWTKKPVKKNRKGHIIVHFDTRDIGTFEKTLKIYSNAVNSPVQLIIRGVINFPQKEMKKH